MLAIVLQLCYQTITKAFSQQQQQQQQQQLYIQDLKNIKNVGWHAKKYANKVGMMHKSNGQHNYWQSPIPTAFSHYSLIDSMLKS